jgi:hypothetical protein
VARLFDELAVDERFASVLVAHTGNTVRFLTVSRAKRVAIL